MATGKTNPAKNEVDEIETVTFTVNIRGKEVELTAPASLDDAPMDAGLAFEDEKYMKAFSIMLGPSQMQKLRNAGARSAEFGGTIMNTWSDATGLGED
ncbi:hypothetical protein [Corynebacterium diphtheriae]|uniref:hypothetical protein n=1 Tax=Corynebacterium diphtheriae TaxID=1717 RepID=UPI0002FA5672|nr:hypothetical protein [Corynebacterium diphtheriae]OJI03952.1 hypothetical protein BKD75_01535 [Corynebacterium diphtheriae]VEJ67472.1 Uncharacterised protein [Corynebacterium diphtheriae]